MITPPSKIHQIYFLKKKRCSNKERLKHPQKHKWTNEYWLPLHPTKNEFHYLPSSLREEKCSRERNRTRILNQLTDQEFVFKFPTLSRRACPVHNCACFQELPWDWEVSRRFLSYVQPLLFIEPISQTHPLVAPLPHLPENPTLTSPQLPQGPRPRGLLATLLKRLLFRQYPPLPYSTPLIRHWHTESRKG